MILKYTIVSSELMFFFAGPETDLVITSDHKNVFEAQFDFQSSA